MRKLLITAAMVASALVIPASHASASDSVSCVTHSPQMGGTIVHSGEQMMIGEAVGKCGEGLGVRVRIIQRLIAPSGRQVSLGHSNVRLGNWARVQFRTIEAVGTYTVHTWITNRVTGAVLATDTVSFACMP